MRRGSAVVFGAVIVAASLSLSLTPALAQADSGKLHAHSLIGAPKYGPGFSHFDYVNPDAPKVGLMRIGATGSFDTLNPFSIQGQPAGLITTYLYEQLMTGNMEESSAEYGLLAEWMRYPDDYSSVTFKLRKEARWHDGTPVSVEDVIFSLTALKENLPFYALYYKNVVQAEETAPYEVTFSFDTTGNRELPQIVGQLYVLPKHYWTGVNAEGTARNIAKSTLETPLGSGPYRISEAKSGKSIRYQRVADYWGKDLPVNVGHYNYDEVRLEYFKDSTVALEAFKADLYDFRGEGSAKNWVSAYNIPALKDGRIIKEKFKLGGNEPMQAFGFNLRRAKFSDKRVRRAFNLAFDFEWLNNNLFYNEYQRMQSFFQSSELQSTGLATGRELEILEDYRGQLDDEIFNTAYKNPVNEDKKMLRGHLLEARDLLIEAGWVVRNNALVNEESGEIFTVEFLLAPDDATFERVVNPYTKALEKLGVQTKIRLVDAAQYQRRVDYRDFDMIVPNRGAFAQSDSPGNEQREFWGSEAADRPASRNVLGIRNDVIDALIERIIFAPDRAELVALTRALDRILMHEQYVVPQWYSPFSRTVRWNRFSFPENLPKLGLGTYTFWWWDEEKARATELLE